jgi:hypothetical protein
VGIQIYDPQLELDVDESRHVGRYYCTPSSDWIRTLGGFLSFGNFVLAILLAWQGRHLPSVFNEKSAIFNSLAIAAGLILINVVGEYSQSGNGIFLLSSILTNDMFVLFSRLLQVVLELTNSITTPPDASVSTTSNRGVSPHSFWLLSLFRFLVFMQVSLILATTAINLINIVWPKISRSLKGDKVVVGQLLQAYGKEGVPSDYGNAGTTVVLNFLSGELIPMHKDDPLPSSIEIQIHTVHNILGTVVDRR